MRAMLAAALALVVALTLSATQPAPAHAASYSAANVAVTASAKTYKSGAYKYKRLSDGTVKITKYTGSRNVTKLTVPAKLGGRTVSIIGKKSFGQLEMLRTLTIPKGVTRIGEGAFGYCYRLKTLNLPSTLKRVDAGAFEYSAVKNLKLPNKLTKIGWFAFTGAQCVTLPKAMKSFEWRDYVTGDGTCTLRKIKVAKGSKYFSTSKKGDVLYNKNKTKLVYYLPNNQRTSFTVPNSVKVIDTWAFDCCFSLKRVKLGKNVTTLNKGAFLGTCTGETFTLPASVKKLGEYSIGHQTETLVVKTKKLTAKNVKNCLKGFSYVVVKVQVSNDSSVNQKYVEKYRDVFTAANTGANYVYVTA